MNFVPAELIKKKRNGSSLTAGEIRFLIESYSDGRLPDYQMSAWLMAVYFKGMSSQETAILTETMMNSGHILDFSYLPQPAVDKHSTGGVGDKTSLILAPLVAAAGVRVPMIAGRGLGHTGGTLDKLESIPGFRIDLSLDQFKKQVESFGAAIIGQTGEICPADKKIYALRDVTGTVESLPLICASIMSKKLAEGIKALVLDVKYGSGAFMKTVEAADQLATHLMQIGSAHGKKVAALLTNMEQPLGRFIGNALEIGECIAIMKREPYLSRGPGDFEDTRELTLELAGHMIWLGDKASNASEGISMARRLLENGAAWEWFEKLCRIQGGNIESLPVASQQFDVISPTDGYISAFETEKIGLASLELGAGRLKTTDPIDFTAGIELHRKLGEEVKQGERLFTLYSSSQNAKPLFARAEETLLKATTISLQKPPVPALIARRKVN